MHDVELIVNASLGNKVVIVVIILSQPYWFVSVCTTVPVSAGLHDVVLIVTASLGNKVVIVVTTLSQPY